VVFGALQCAGEWLDGFMHGIGIFEAPDGSKYQVGSSFAAVLCCVVLCCAASKQ
jgi:hypothetical protein